MFKFSSYVHHICLCLHVLIFGILIKDLEHCIEINFGLYQTLAHEILSHLTDFVPCSTSFYNRRGDNLIR